MMSITAMLHVAMARSLAEERALQDRWNQKFIMLGTLGALPGEHSDGRVDILLRKLDADALSTANDERLVLTFGMELHRSLSRYWVLSMYETLRTVWEKNCESAEITALLRRFELVRIPLAKAQIAKDRSLETDLTLLRFPHGGELGEPDPRQYGPKNKFPYRPVEAICTVTGSWGWYPVDVSTRTNPFISRRMLSDETLALLD